VKLPLQVTVPDLPCEAPTAKDKVAWPSAPVGVRLARVKPLGIDDTGDFRACGVTRIRELHALMP